MKKNHAHLVLAVILLAASCRKDVNEVPPSSTSTPTAAAERTAPNWLVSKVTHTDLISNTTSEYVFSYNGANKPIREIKTARSYNNQISRDTFLYAYNSAQQLIRYTHATRGSSAVLEYNAQGKLSRISSYGELLSVKYSYPNDTVVLANFGVRHISLKPHIYAYAKVIYFIYDRNGNLRAYRDFYKQTSLSDQVGITDTTGIQPTVYNFDAYGNKASVEYALNIPGPGALGLISRGYDNDEDFYPQFPANNILHSRIYDRYEYTYNTTGLPVEVTASWSSGPVSRFKLEYIPAN